MIVCPAVRPDPTRLWYVRVLDSTGGDMISHGKAWHEMVCHGVT